MSFFPMLRAPNCDGFVGICNFSPNNWEIRSHQSQFINLTWSFNGVWTTRSLGKLARGACRTITASEILDFVPREALPLFSLTSVPLPEKSFLLPEAEFLKTVLPVWRSTLGLASANAKTSYQGELNVFPTEGSLLTFNHFLQYGKNIKNYLLIVNIEQSPEIRTADLEVYNTSSCNLIQRFSIQSNSCNVISLDDLPFSNNDLPLFICRNMTGIPLYFSSFMDGNFLSLEHSHPPASLVIHGRRWEAQKLLKNRWFAKVVK